MTWDSGGNGTGGLLIISCTSLEGSGTISSHGVNSARATGAVNLGGGSGGGTINIFYKSSYGFTGVNSSEGGLRRWKRRRWLCNNNRS
jgi:hypothetical protein